MSEGIAIGGKADGGVVIPLRDALLLARANWTTLLIAPLVTTVLAMAIYVNLPVRHAARVDLNVPLEVLIGAIDAVRAQIDDSISIEGQAGNRGGISVLTVEAAAPDTALAALRHIVDGIPAPLPEPDGLTPNERLELRAQHQYLAILRKLVAAGKPDGGSPPLEYQLVEQEVANVQARIAHLMRRSGPVPALPLMAAAPRVTPSNLPPRRNVLVFVFFTALFATWLVIYTRERRRLTQAYA